VTRLTHLPELIKKLRGLMKEQMNEADLALIGVGDVHLRCKYQPAKSQARVALHVRAPKASPSSVSSSRRNSRGPQTVI